MSLNSEDVFLPDGPRFRRIIFSHKGEAVPDYAVREYAMKLNKEDIHVSTSNVVDCARALWMQEYIKAESLSIIVVNTLGERTQYPVDMYGRLTECPPDLDGNMEWLTILCGWDKTEEEQA